MHLRPQTKTKNEQNTSKQTQTPGDHTHTHAHARAHTHRERKIVATGITVVIKNDFVAMLVMRSGHTFYCKIPVHS